jgi:hypothetical protein
VLLSIALFVAAGVFGIHSYRYRFVKTNGDLFRFLPNRGYTTFYCNVEAMRRSGTLRLLTGTKAAQESEYRDFVRQTQFDYSRDLNAVAGATDGQRSYLLVKGDFSWDRLRQYTTENRGACERGVCSLAANRNGRWISFVSIQPDVLGIALSSDRWAASTFTTAQHPLADPVPVFPIWVRVSHQVLEHPEGLPLALKIFAISLQSAERVVLSLGPGRNESHSIELRLDAAFRNNAAAETVRAQFEMQTQMLKTELSRQHAVATTGDLTGLLTAGRFQASGTQLVGLWPVRDQLLKTLE